MFLAQIALQGTEFIIYSPCIIFLSVCNVSMYTCQTIYKCRLYMYYNVLWCRYIARFSLWKM